MAKASKSEMSKGEGKKRKASVVEDNITSTFSLFNSSKDAALEDIFSKSAAFARPESTPRSSLVASSSKAAREAKAPLVTKKVKRARELVSVEVDNITNDDANDVQVMDNEEISDNLDDSGEEDLVHESLKSPTERRKRVKSDLKKYTPPNESASDRDRRTIFIGNLGVDVAKSKSSQNLLRAHLLTFAPSAKIESIRFRSVAFATPTAGLPGDSANVDEAEATRRAKREKERAAAWRAVQDDAPVSGGAGNRRGVDDVVDTSKTYIDAKGKRRVAFIKQEFHSDMATCNAYVVFEHPHPDRPKNVAPILDPYEAASKALSANGSTFIDRTIRVDSLRLPSAVALVSATNALGKRDAWLPSGTDPKRSLFVGGLDYAAKEEDVRAFFEALVTGERGSATGGHWVTDVRIVRDKDTQMGKGFGYVHFVDRESADEIIAMSAAKLKFAKKPLRIQPCKTLPPAAPKAKVTVPVTSATGAAASKSGSKAIARPAGPLPKGNPALGARIKDLSKEERKVVKSTDAERQARRLAKKKAKVVSAHTESGAVKLTATKAERGRKAKNVKAKKGRTRSEHALKNMKGSRT